MDRRTAIKAAAIAPLAGLGPDLPAPKQPVALSSHGGPDHLERIMAELKGGADPVVAVVEGVTMVEDDPKVISVGYGGLPNADGVVELDASVMHGPSHKAGAVGGLQNIRNPAKVALEVLRRTDHVMLVGDGALQFARAVGFEEENLLTDRARNAWVRWKAKQSPDDDWLDEDQQIDVRIDAHGIPRTTGTIHCAAVNTSGDVGACTSTSGMSYKIPGRVGDSPIVGAGMFVDNEVGAAGSVGRGEAVIQSAGAFQVVRNMAAGMEPEDACLETLKWIVRHTKRPALLNHKGEPAFGCVMYALRKDGVAGAASMRGRPNFFLHDGTERKAVKSATLPR